MKIKRLYSAEDFTVNQLYMFMEYNYRLERGFCTCITEKDVTFTYQGRTITVKYKEWDSKQNYFAEYNASVFRKYQKLVELQKQELDDLLERNTYSREKDVILEEVQLKKSKKVKVADFFWYALILYCSFGGICLTFKILTMLFGSL